MKERNSGNNEGEKKRKLQKNEENAYHEPGTTDLEKF